MSKDKIPKRDFLIAEPVDIVSSATRFTFSKDNIATSRQSLRAKVRMTYAGLKTKNRAVYLPNEHFKSAHTFLEPYNKPVQVHHQDHIDPIGRVIDVRYVDTTAAAAVIDKRVKSSVLKIRDERASLLDQLNATSLFLDLSQNPNYKGIGHILGLWDVSDPEAIQKLLDGRYLTVSTGMMPKHAYCSTCARDDTITDWAIDFCEHDRGRIYDGTECVVIPTDYEWEEVSPVNHPAAPLSQVVEVGHGLSFNDASTVDLNQSSPQEIFEDFYLLTEGSDSALRIRDGQRMKPPTLDSDESLENPDPPIDAIESPTPTQRKNLPAAAFAAPFYDGDGEFISSKSKLPHHINAVKKPTSNSSVDIPRLRNALARFNQTSFSGLPSGAKEKARKHLESHANEILKSRQDDSILQKKNINGLALDYIDFKQKNFEAIEKRHQITEGSGTTLRAGDEKDLRTPKSNNKKDSQMAKDKLVFSSSDPNQKASVSKKPNQNRKLTASISEKVTNDSVIGEKRIPHMEVTGTMAHELTVLSEDTISNYEAIAAHLEDGIVRLTNEELDSLDDNVFIGPNRTFPVVDNNHVTAIRKLLEGIEDSEAKATLNTFLDEQEENINDTETDENTEGVTAGSENTENTAEETNTETTEGNTENANSENIETTSETEDSSGEAGETVTINTGELEELQIAADQYSEVELDRNLWKARSSRLEDEVKQLTMANASLLREQKVLLAEGLVDAQAARGFAIEDRVAVIATYSNRSIQSLKDSLSDLKAKNAEGVSRIPSGERVPDPRITDSADSEDEAVIQDLEQAASEYNGILERYWNIYYGPGGHKAATNFLDSVKRDGIVPQTLQP